MSDDLAPTPEEEASEGALAAAERFFVGVAQGDGRAVWSLFSEGARAFVLNIALERGMDFDLASRLRAGTATDEEVDEYLVALLEGIRLDLRGVDLPKLAFESTAEPHAPLQVRVRYLVQLDTAIGGVAAAVPAGSLVLIYEHGEWKVERLVPRPG